MSAGKLISLDMLDYSLRGSIPLDSFPIKPPEANDNGRFVRALDFIRAQGGGHLTLSGNKTYVISQAQVIPSNTRISGGGWSTVVQLVANTYASVLTTNPSLVNTNIILDNFVIDANYSGLDESSVQKAYHALYLRRVMGLNLDKIHVKNPVAWCANIVDCVDVMVTDYRATSAGHQMDGIHFVDSNDVILNGAIINSGDDCVGITVDNKTEMKNIIINNVKGTSQIASLIRLNQSDRSVAANGGVGETKIMRNMHFKNLYAYQCGNRGFSASTILPQSTLENIHIEGIFEECGREGMRIDEGLRIKVDVTIQKCGTGITRMPATEGILRDSATFYQLDHSDVKLTIVDVSDGCHGVTFNYGQHNTIWADVDYMKAGKLDPKSCINLEGTGYSTVARCVLKDAKNGILVGKDATSAAVRNTIKDNTIRDMSGIAIVEGVGGQSNFNRIFDNNLVTVGSPAIQRQGLNTVVARNDGHRTDNKGFVTFNIATGTTLVVNHGIYTTPNYVKAFSADPQTYGAEVSNITSTQFTITLPAPVTVDGRKVMWEAEF